MLDCPLDLLARVLGARLRGAPQSLARRVRVDSRLVQPGDLFVALPGEQTDGHQFLAAAFAQGASGAIVQRRKVPATDTPGPLLEVPDTLLALGELAAWHRNRFDLPVVAVTGSVGKTTTKDFIAGVLSRQWVTLKSPASWNAEVGLPLTLLELNASHQALVVEMAMRGTNQIRYLARIARPRIAVITHVGLSHMELLGSQEAIAAAKSEVLDYLPHDGCAVLNADDPYFEFLSSRVAPGARVLSFALDSGAKDAVAGTYLGVGPQEAPRGAEAPSGVLGARFAVRGAGGRKVTRMWIPLLGRHNVRNALAAAAVGDVLGISPTRIARGLAEAETAAMRMTPREIPGGGTLLDDAYNASTPEAMLAALDVLRELPGARKIAVLGTMMELGDASDEAHQRVGTGLAQLSPDLLVAVGEGGAKIAAGALAAGLAPGNVARRATNEEALELLREAHRPGDLILVKGSRGMAMETIVRGLTEAERAHAA
jgi:UDP-N-acetylmuramoyl-tripeptide--D-alanyl-D-alanine ligase